MRILYLEQLIDTGILAIAALIGASFAGVLGAVVGGVVGDSITGGLAGLFEGRVAEHYCVKLFQDA